VGTPSIQFDATMKKGPAMLFTTRLRIINNPPQRSAVVPALVLAAAAGVLVAGTAFAKLAANTIDPVAFVTHQGRHLVVTGPVTCDRVEWIHQRVTVTQRATGAVAEGHLRFACGTERQQWELRATAHGNEVFAPGPATAVAVAVSGDGGVATDAHQWLVNITLVAR
jgi:hypothetical protein